MSGNFTSCFSSLSFKAYFRQDQDICTQFDVLLQNRITENTAAGLQFGTLMHLPVSEKKRAKTETVSRIELCGRHLEFRFRDIFANRSA